MNCQKVMRPHMRVAIDDRWYRRRGGLVRNLTFIILFEWADANPFCVVMLVIIIIIIK